MRGRGAAALRRRQSTRVEHRATRRGEAEFGFRLGLPAELRRPETPTAPKCLEVEVFGGLYGMPLSYSLRMKDRPGAATERVVIERAGALDGAQATPSLSADLDRLFGTHEDQIHRLCIRMVGDPDRAREITQETLLVAWTRIDEFEGRARFGTWIHSIARNLCFNAIRKRKDMLTADGILEAESAEASVFAQLRQAERKEVVLQAASAVLTDEEQEAVWLRYGEGVGQDAITRIMGLEGSGARGLLQRCRRKLTRELRKRLIELGHASTFFDQ